MFGGLNFQFHICPSEFLEMVPFMFISDLLYLIRKGSHLLSFVKIKIFQLVLSNKASFFLTPTFPEIENLKLT
jgi:hypothetical protein